MSSASNFVPFLTMSCVQQCKATPAILLLFLSLLLFAAERSNLPGVAGDGGNGRLPRVEVIVGFTVPFLT